MVIKILRIVPTVLLGSFLLGCPAGEETEIVSTLQSALSALTQNRALTEQFVRDVKANIPPGDPTYVQTMEAYQDAREANNRYLDAAESGVVPSGERSLHSSSPREVVAATSDFLERATNSLRPSLNTRDIPYQRAIIVPDNLQTIIAKLPKKARITLTDNVDPQIRWRTWSQI